MYAFRVSINSGECGSYSEEYKTGLIDAIQLAKEVITGANEYHGCFDDAKVAYDFIKFRLEIWQSKYEDEYDLAVKIMANYVVHLSQNHWFLKQNLVSKFKRPENF